MNTNGQLIIILEQLLNGINVGSFYALIALGYTMVYGVLSMINFAHGDIFMVGAYIGFFTINRLTDAGLTASNPALAILITFLAGSLGAALVGITVERIAYRPLRKATRLASLISAIGASIFLQELIRLIPTIGNAIVSIKIGGMAIFSAQIRQGVMKVVGDMGGAMIKTYPGVLSNDGFQLGGVFISYSRLLIVLISVVVMVILYTVVRTTKLGKAMRAVAEDKETASLMGINVNQVITRTFFIGSALAGLAGVMVGMFYLQIRPTMGFTPGIKAFTAAVLGGIGNIPGAMVGGYVLGIAEVISIQFLPAVYKDVVAFVILILVLIFKPTGIMGSATGQKKM
jgi:branched-chain amino acid transport system permease protein